MASKGLIPGTELRGVVTYKLYANGLPLKDTYRVITLAVKRKVNRISSAKIVLHDGDPAQQDFEVSNTSDFVPGSSIQIDMGYDSENEKIFEGIVVNHSIKVRSGKPSVLSLELKDVAVKMTVGRKSAFYNDLSDQEAIKKIIGNYDLTSDLESTSVVHGELVQYHSTDWDFMVSRADANGKLIYNYDGEIAMKSPIVAPTELSVVYGSSLVEFEGEIDARWQYDSITAASWDITQQETVAATASLSPLSTLGNQGNLSSKKLSEVIGLPIYELIHSGNVVPQELQAWADSKLQRSELSRIRGRVKFHGYQVIKPGDTINLDGVGDRFNGLAFVSGVVQELNGGTWFTNVEIGLSPNFFTEETIEIENEPASGLLPAIEGLQIGVVSGLASDPNTEERIKVRIPIVDNDNDGIWARLGNVLSGSESGAFFVPDIGDEVIVGFINNDPRQAIVLGSMFSSGRKAPFEITDDNFEKGIVTKTGLKLVFNDDDENRGVTIETPEGNKLILEEKDGSVQLEDQNSNKIHLNSDGITIESAKDIALKATGDIKLEGANIEASAQTEFKADGKAGSEVSSSAITKVSGQFVHIN